jgi:hypothetical protein
MLTTQLVLRSRMLELYSLTCLRDAVLNYKHGKIYLSNNNELFKSNFFLLLVKRIQVFTQKVCVTWLTLFRRILTLYFRNDD